MRSAQLIEYGLLLEATLGTWRELIMSVEQTLLDFYETSLDFSKDEDRSKVFDVLRSCNVKGPVVATDLGEQLGYIFVFVGDDGGHWTMRSYANGLVSLDITQIVKDGQSALLSKEALENLKKSLEERFSCKKSRRLPRILRQGPFNPYLCSMDERLLEYDIDRVVVDENSQYQNIKILHSKIYGNILVLDDDVNLAESDILYTRAITGQDREDYKDKTVLILGGGDGGILHELLKENPKQVIMAEIDEVVINHARTHLRGICGDSLDSLKGDNYEVIVGDCVKVMNQYLSEGKVFDYVINDLTAIPISTEPRGSQWDFMRLILDLSMKVLAPKGKYFTQGNGFCMTDALEMYEEQLRQLSCPVEFRKENVHVPSYLELWVFYEIWKKDQA